jgi:leucyl/phenylalanyl-tRNA--protein transferase
VLFPEEFHASRRLVRVIRSGGFEVTTDRAFRDVIRACAEIPRSDQDGTWITEEMIEAYCGLHSEGFAHSIECWKNGALVGGLYGVALGTCFFGESMFSRESDASKAALATLVERMKAFPGALIDCQVTTPHLQRMGAREISRRVFLERIKEGVRVRVSPWA